MKDSQNAYYLIDITKEPILERLDENNVVTLNSYEARCLNSKNLWIADVDFKTYLEKRRVRKSLFSKEEEKEIKAFEDLIINYDKAYSYRNKVRQELISKCFIKLIKPQEGSYHIYETHSGLRLIRTDKPMKPRSRESVSCHFHVNADPRYRELCIYQNCYRARLSPKPWRSDEDLEDQICVARRMGSYTVKNGKKLGKHYVDPSLEDIIDCHDIAVGAFSGKRDLIA